MLPLHAAPRPPQVFHGMVYSDLLTNPLIVPVKILRGHEVVDYAGMRGQGCWLWGARGMCWALWWSERGVACVGSGGPAWVPLCAVHWCSLGQDAKAHCQALPVTLLPASCELHSAHMRPCVLLRLAGVLDCVWHPHQPWVFTAGADGSICLFVN